MLMTTWEHRTVQANGVDLAVFVAPATSITESRATPIVFLHGGPGDDHTYLRPFAATLHAQLGGRHSVILYDQRGSGLSRPGKDFPRAASYFEFHRLVDDLDRVIDAVAGGRAIVGGHSWGAMHALAYAALRTERTEKAVMIGMGPLDTQGEEIFTANFDRLFSAAEREEHFRLKAERKAAFASGDADRGLAIQTQMLRGLYARAWVVDDAARAEFISTVTADPGYDRESGGHIWNGAKVLDWWHLAKEVTAPSLIVYGWQDIEPVAQAFRLAQVMPAVELAMINRAGHMPWLERPDLVWPRLTDFIQGESRQAEETKSGR